MIYADTSVTVPIYCPEPVSAKAQRYLSLHGPLAISPLVRVEFASALARRVRLGELSTADAARIRSMFNVQIGEGIYQQLMIEAEHYDHAEQVLAQSDCPLRSLDALHLAIAACAGLQVITADKPMALAAKTLGVKCRLLEP